MGCCCGQQDCDCCGACQDASPCGFSARINGRWYHLKPFLANAATNGTCIFIWTGTARLGSTDVTEIDLYVWNRSNPTEPYAYTLSARDGGVAAQVWEKTFGLTKIDCTKSYTLPETETPFGTFGDAEVVPTKTRLCCCAGCGAEGTPDTCAISIPDGLGGTLVLTARRPQYGSTSIYYCDRFTADLDTPLDLYGATGLNYLSMTFTVGPGSGGMTLSLANTAAGDPHEGEETAWVETAVGDNDCASTRTLVPASSALPTFFPPPDDAIINFGAFKVCDSPVCCANCGTFTPQEWLATVEGVSATLTNTRTGSNCTWSGTFTRTQLVSGCYADSMTLVVTTVSGMGEAIYTLTIYDGATVQAVAVVTELPGVDHCQTTLSLLIGDQSTACALLTGYVTLDPQRLHTCGSVPDFCDLCQAPEEYAVTFDGYVSDIPPDSPVPCTAFGQDSYRCPECSSFGGDYFTYQDATADPDADCYGRSITYRSEAAVHCHRRNIRGPAGGFDPPDDDCDVIQEFDVSATAIVKLCCDPGGTVTIRCYLVFDLGPTTQMFSLTMDAADFSCDEPYELVSDPSNIVKCPNSLPTCIVTPL